MFNGKLYKVIFPVIDCTKEKIRGKRKQNKNKEKMKNVKENMAFFIKKRINLHLLNDGKTFQN